MNLSRISRLPPPHSDAVIFVNPGEQPSSVINIILIIICSIVLATRLFRIICGEEWLQWQGCKYLIGDGESKFAS